MALPVKGRGRKPVHLTALGGRPRGRQIVWEKIRAMRSFTLNDLASEAFAETEAVRTYVQSLVKARYLRATPGSVPKKGHRGYVPLVYTLINDIGIEAPRLQRDGSPCLQGAAREQMWRTMRMLRAFNARELAMAASTEQKAVAVIDARDYLKHLAQAGYVSVVVKSKPGTLARYSFISARYSGPLPPMIQRLNTVYDPNLGKIVWQQEPDA